MLRSTFRTNGGFSIYAAIFFLLLASCQREAKDSRPDTGIGAGDAVMVTAGIRGVVVDENNQPVSGAAVKSGNNTTTTDRYGVFRFNNIQLSKANGYVRVEKAGYFNGNRSFVTMEGRIHNVRIKLLPKTISGTFAANTGGTVSLISGGKMTMPANAVTDASGNAYNGTVSVAMTWIDPTAANLPEIMVGDLRGITTGGEERGLATYGMLGVELSGTGGQPLKIATGKTAALIFPIPASMAGTAPNAIDLWHFDESKGRWIQEGTATRAGTNYVAQVSHFSFWNCDAPFPLINLCMRLVNAANSQPLINVQVRIKRNDGSYSYGYTDSTGNLCGKVPKNEPLVLQVMDLCNGVAYSQNIGPYIADAALGTINTTFTPASVLTVTGTITNCSNANVTNGSAMLYTAGANSYSVPVTNGTFTFSILRCGSNSINFTVLGIDNAAQQQSIPAGGSGISGNVSMGTIQACGTSSAEFFEYMIEGTPYVFSSPPDSINCGRQVFPFAGYSYLEVAFGNKSSGPIGIGGFSLYFYNNGMTGTLPIKQGHMQYTISVQALSFVDPNPVVNITTFGPPAGGFIEGNFNELMIVSGVPKMVSCNFRVRRN